ncbi:MAG: tetratricopeptide repeat protein [Thermodesulfobacteriota bacterium]
METKARRNYNGAEGPPPGPRPAVAFLLIAGLAVIVYSNTLTVPFVFDDLFVIINNPYIHDLGNLWPPVGARYVGHVTFALNYSAGGLGTAGYHLVNIAIHIVNGALVYTLVRYIFTTPLMREFLEGRDKEPVLYIALLSALIFTVHPVNTQGVNYITQRFTSLATLFYLLTIILYLKWRNSTGKDRRAAFYALSLLAAVAAQRTKEISFTLPFMIVFFEFVFFPAAGGFDFKKRVFRLAPFLLCLLIIPLSLFGPALAGMVFGAGGGAGASGGGAAGGLAAAVPLDLKEIPHYNYLITQLRVVITYLRLIILPVAQNLDYDYPVFQSLWTPNLLLSLLAHIVIVSSAIYLFLRSRARKNPYLLIISTGLFWFYTALAVESIAPLVDVINEHRLYLPGIGIFISISTAVLYGFSRVREKISLKTSYAAAALIIACFTVLPLAAIAYGRNMVWRDIIVLYEDIVKKSPGKARAHNNLGAEYAKRGAFEKAIKEFRVTLALDATLHGTIKNLAKALMQKGLVDEAAGEYVRYLETTPGDIEARENLAEIYYKKGAFESAAEEYKMILVRRPGHIKARNNLANIFFLQGRLDKAVKEYRTVLSIKPDHVETLFNMAIALEKKGDRRGAAAYYRRFIEVAPPEYSSAKEGARNKLRVLQLQK